MPITTSKLRSDIYNLLDKVLQTGKPLEIARKGKKLTIVPSEQVGKLARLVPHKCINGDPQDLVHEDWVKEWKHDLP